jgi:hypothetical protein
VNERQAVSSPVATGGAGTFFEQHVDAMFLALLLVRGIPPVLIDCQVEKVELQTERLGWTTDDLLIAGTGRVGRRQLAAQIKRQFTISSKNDDCMKTFSDFWSDFTKNDRFDPSNDGLALVTLRGTDALLNSFNSLLDCARASSSAADFNDRLATPGYLSKAAIGYAIAIKTIIAESHGEEPSADDYWRFLRVLHVVSLDLHTDTARDEASIKSLLAQTCQEADSASAAEATWRELLEIAGKGMSSAVSYSYDDLPQRLRNRHGPVPTDDHVALQALSAHSAMTLSGIQTTIAQSVSIPRNTLVSCMLELLETSQVVVVAGPAGCGKSALVRNAIEILASDRFCLTFRSEEFAVPHIDHALQRVQASLNVRELQALLAAQGRKVIHVESIERLLEASVRDAFSDLLHLSRQGGSTQLVLTCRDYALETVRTFLLEQAALRHTVLEVPPLTDEELAHVVRNLPALATPMANTRLKELLRSPYLLDKAARLDWSKTALLPTDERTFRLKCWHEVIRRDAVATDRLPRRREQVFLDLAVRRAKALSPYVACDEFDPQALDALSKDGLVVMSPETEALAAPAHDVLEDWAIVQWLREQFALRNDNTRGLADEIGGYPALRRGYRKWLGEMLECETERADGFVLASFRDESLPAHVRDDTLVSTLLSSSVRSFLARQREALLADEARLLIRAIHLLRVACKATPTWLPDGIGAPSQVLVPNGEGWPAVLETISATLDRLLPKNMGLLLGLLEDWVKAVAWTNPEPPGFHEAGRIAFVLLDHLGGYHMADMRKRVLGVIAKIPRAQAGGFKELLRRGRTHGREDRVIAEVADILLNGFDGWYACRDFPREIARLAKAHLLLSKRDLRSDRDDYGSTTIEPSFGVRPHTDHDFFPASAMRGPFFPLLRNHPRVGLKFIVDIFNHAGTWYGAQRWPYHRLEPASQLTIDIPGEGRVTQWTNARLWGLYRGVSVGPYVLQSALMALEAWLLDACRTAEIDVEATLLRLLRESNNVAITAVVASVCNAHPEKGGRAAFALLTSRELIAMERARLVQDRGYSLVFDIVPGLDAANEFYNDERKKSGSLPHRKDDLEALAVKLQLGAQREQVQQILDQHRANLPPIEKQSDEHRLWRLALHRMDLRGYRPVDPQPCDEAGTSGNSGERARVCYAPGAIEPDVRELVDRHAALSAGTEADLALLNWGSAIWGGDGTSGIDSGAWTAKLAEAKQRDREPREFEEFARGGSGFIAAVCARDHWDELALEDREWCVRKLIGEVERNCDADDYSIRIASGPLDPDRAAAYVLPRVLREGDPQSADVSVVEAIAKALTHSVSEVIVCAAAGIGYYLQGAWRDFAMRCVGTLARQARLIGELQAAQKQRRIDQQRSFDELVRTAATNVRECIRGGELDVGREIAQLDLSEWPDQEATLLALRILGYWGDSADAINFHGATARALAANWPQASGNPREPRSRNHRFEFECSRRIAHFVLKLQTDDALAICAPVLARVPVNPEEVARFVKDLIAEEDCSEETTSFWFLWQAFADRASAAPWAGDIDSEYSRGAELLRAMFVGGEWKQGVRHWRKLEGQGKRIDVLVAKLPPTTPVLTAYCGFLYAIGERSLPDAFVVVADRLRAGDASQILNGTDVTFYLESLLGRYVYGEPLRVKSNAELRQAVLYILDALVETGSSAAFRMRDDFVTPIAGRS